MRKNLRLITLCLIICGWWHSGRAQRQANLQQYYYWADDAITFVPMAGYKTEKDWYIESRYNYEDINSLSMYLGKTFTRESQLSYSLTPMGGLVFGLYKGASIAANIELDYKSFYIFSQPQYTFSVDARANNFIYSWSDIGAQITDWFGAGLSFQHTRSYQSESILEKGLFMELSVRNWSFPAYIYNPESSSRYFLIGLNYAWEGKRKQPKQIDKPVPAQPLPPLASAPQTVDSKVANVQKVEGILNEKIEAPSVKGKHCGCSLSGKRYRN